jgi:hypothetical protein
MITISMLFFFLKQTYGHLNSFQIDSNRTSRKLITFVCGKVSNNHEKEEQEHWQEEQGQEWWRLP